MTLEREKDEFPVLMERKVKFQPADGSELVDVIVQIGYPKWTKPNFKASCPVAFRGGIGRVRDIIGVDPINAMKNVLIFIESYQQRGENEGTFFWSDGTEYTGG